MAKPSGPWLHSPCCRRCPPRPASRRKVRGSVPVRYAAQLGAVFPVRRCVAFPSSRRGSLRGGTGPLQTFTAELASISCLRVDNRPCQRLRRGDGRSRAAQGPCPQQIIAWWFQQFDGIVKHHLISADADEIVGAVPALAAHRSAIDGRATLCRRTTVFPVECVVRGYLSGSAWKEYATQRHIGRRTTTGMLLARRAEPSHTCSASAPVSRHQRVGAGVSWIRAAAGAGKEPPSPRLKNN